MAKKTLFSTLLDKSKSEALAKDVPAADKMKSRFDVSMSFLKEYAIFLQTIQHQNESFVSSAVMAMADELVSKHSFGGTFTEELRTFVKNQFSFSFTKTKAAIASRAGCDEETTDGILYEISGDVEDLMEHRFSPVLKM